MSRLRQGTGTRISFIPKRACRPRSRCRPMEAPPTRLASRPYQVAGHVDFACDVDHKGLVGSAGKAVLCPIGPRRDISARALRESQGIPRWRATSTSLATSTIKALSALPARPSYARLARAETSVQQPQGKGKGYLGGGPRRRRFATRTIKAVSTQ